MGHATVVRADVVVLGGGPAGIGAAIAAARMGAKVLLVERHGFVGGNMNIGLALHTFHDAFGRQVIRGIPHELISRVRELGGTTGPVRVYGAHMASTAPIDAEVMRHAALEMLEESGASLLLHTLVFDACVVGGRLRAVVAATKSGLLRLEADAFVDATGDGDVAAAAGAPFEKGRGGPEERPTLQPMSMVFKMANVDLAAVVESVGTGYAKAVKPGCSEPDYVWFAASLERWRHLIDDPAQGLPRNYRFWGNSIRPREANINATRITGLDGTSVWDLTRAELEGRRQVRRFARFLVEHVPGFERAYVVSTAPFVGVRETRRILGEYVLTHEDLRTGRAFPDAVCRAGYPVDIHDARGGETYFETIGGDGAYDIPYRCLVPLAVDGLLVAGRCISATPEAMASLRVMVVAMAIGQAAGVAAAMACKTGRVPRELDPDAIREALAAQGAILQGSVPSDYAT